MKKSIIFSGVLFSLLFAGTFLFVLEIKATASGDANGDCSVNALDLVFVRNKFGRDVNILDNGKADVNGDGKIDILDFVFIRNHLGETCPPDPGSYEVIDFGSGWNIISTPKVISSYEFSVPETAEYLDIRLLDSSFPSGWGTMQEIGQTKFEPLYAYFIYNKTDQVQTLRLNYDDDLAPDQRLFKRTLQPGWNAIGVANPNYALQKGTGDVDTNNVSKILDSIIDSTGLVIDFSAYEEDLDSVKMGDFWVSKTPSQVNDLNDFRELKGYGVFITKTADYTGFQNIGVGEMGSLTVAEDGITIDSTPDVGDTDVIALKFKITAGSTESITVESITGMKVGTSDVSDTANIELYDVTNNVSLGTAANWDADERVTWGNLNLVIGKGKTIRFKVLLDILDDPSKTVNVDLIDGSDVLMSVKGNTYGFYIIPISPVENWASVARRGRGANDQTINTGSLTISPSASTPATGNISSGSDIVVAVFDFDAKGEDVRISAIQLIFSSLVGLGNSDFTNIALYDENDTIVAGPVDAGDTTTDRAVYTDTFIVPVGIHEYTVKLTIADSASNTDAFVIGVLTPGSSITAKGMTSGDDITPTANGTQDGNTLTIAASTLVTTTLASPAARSFPDGSRDFVLATFSLDASSSGEDVLLTNVTVTDSWAGQANGTDIDNSELWVDLTDGTSTRGDVYETKISDTEQWSGVWTTEAVTSNAYTLSDTITIPKGTFVRMAFVADLVAGATATGSHTFYITGSGTTSTGAVTGKSTSDSYVITGKQIMTLTTKGTLVVTKDSSSPVTGIILGGETETLAVFRLAETGEVEDLDLDQMIVTVSNGSFIDTLYFYHGDDLLLAVPGADTVTAVFPDDTLIIPANDHVEITIKGKLFPVDGSVIVNDSATLKIGFDYDGNSVDTTGKLSGDAVDVVANSGQGSNVQYIYESRPYFSLSSLTPVGGDLYANSNHLLAVFDVEAAAGEDITFDPLDGNLLTIEVSAFMTDTTANSLLFTLKDQDGVTLDTNVEMAASLSNDATTETLTVNSSIPFQFDANTFTVPAGETRKLYIYGDTRQFEDDGDMIQLWIDDGTNVDISWSINSDYLTYHRGDIIFKGDIYANSFVNPS